MKLKKESMSTGNKLHLPDITIFTFCWGTEHVQKSIRAMLIAMDQINFKKSAIITDSTKTDLSLLDDVINKHNIEVYDMKADLNDNLKNDDTNRQGFNSLFLEQVEKYMVDDFCLNVQHDSTVISTQRWKNEFLNYDYIAAPWPMHIIQSSDMVAGRIQNIRNTVGNGGFSLRTRKYVEESAKLEWLHKNEDLNTCIFNYDQMIDKGIKFAPKELACEFSVEHPLPYKDYNRDFLFTYNSFGFHGEFNKGGMNFLDQYQIQYHRCN